MGLSLVIVAAISALGNLFYLYWILANSTEISAIFQEAYGSTPFWVQYAWLLVIFFLLIDLGVILFGRYLHKHKAKEKKYMILALSLLVLIIVIISSMQAFLGFGLTTSVFNLGQI